MRRPWLALICVVVSAAALTTGVVHARLPSRASQRGAAGQVEITLRESRGIPSLPRQPSRRYWGTVRVTGEIRGARDPSYPIGEQTRPVLASDYSNGVEVRASGSGAFSFGRLDISVNTYVRARVFTGGPSGKMVKSRPLLLDVAPGISLQVSRENPHTTPYHPDSIDAIYQANVGSEPGPFAPLTAYFYLRHRGSYKRVAVTRGTNPSDVHVFARIRDRGAGTVFACVRRRVDPFMDLAFHNTQCGRHVLSRSSARRMRESAFAAFRRTR